MRRASKAKREMALDAGIPKGYRELEEGEYVNADCWYLDENGGQRKGDLKGMKGGFPYHKDKHQVIIRPVENHEEVLA